MAKKYGTHIDMHCLGPALSCNMFQEISRAKKPLVICPTNGLVLVARLEQMQPIKKLTLNVKF